MPFICQGLLNGSPPPFSPRLRLTKPLALRTEHLHCGRLTHQSWPARPLSPETVPPPNAPYLSRWPNLCQVWALDPKLSDVILESSFSLCPCSHQTLTLAKEILNIPRVHLLVPIPAATALNPARLFSLEHRNSLLRGSQHLFSCPLHVLISTSMP